MRKGKDGKSFSVSGPGISDLLTEGNKEGVSIHRSRRLHD